MSHLIHRLVLPILFVSCLGKFALADNGGWNPGYRWNSHLGGGKQGNQHGGVAIGLKRNWPQPYYPKYYQYPTHHYPTYRYGYGYRPPTYVPSAPRIFVIPQQANNQQQVVNVGNQTAGAPAAGVQAEVVPPEVLEIPNGAQVKLAAPVCVPPRDA